MAITTIIISNIIICMVGLHTKINSYLSIVRVNSLFKSVLFYKLSITAAAMAPECFGADRSGGKIWGKGQVSVLPW